MGLFARPQRDTLDATTYVDAHLSHSAYLGSPFATTETFLPEMENHAEVAGAAPASIRGDAELDRLNDEVCDHDLRLLRADQRATEDGLRISALEVKVQRLEARIDTFLAARTRERPDIATTVHSAHRAIAEEFRGIVEQKLQSIAREQARRQEFIDKYVERERVPQLMAILCKSLFGDATVPYIGSVQELLHVGDGTSVYESLASVRMAVSRLRKRSQAAGLTAKWEFGGGSAFIDATKQEAWPTCDAGERVCFVVAPAYVVDGQVYARQVVFTG